MNSWKVSSRIMTIIVLMTTSFVTQADEPVSKSYFGGIAIDGHDTVAYHKITADQPHNAIKGNKTWKVQWKGADWLFTNKTDRDLFAADPDAYAPAYNGFCANALSEGKGLVKTNGTHWQIFDNQLYTFYDARGRERWLEGDHKVYKSVADNAWRDIISGK